jgi:hypothetical protein
MSMASAISERISERHGLAWVLLCYFITMLEPRGNVSGAATYMKENYSEGIVLGLTAYFGMGFLLCLCRRQSAFSLAVLSIPQWAYTIVGLWLLFKSPTAPLATFFVHFALFGVTLFLIHARLRGIAKGNSLDDTLTRPS